MKNPLISKPTEDRIQELNYILGRVGRPDIRTYLDIRTGANPTNNRNLIHGAKVIADFVLDFGFEALAEIAKK